MNTHIGFEKERKTCYDTYINISIFCVCSDRTEGQLQEPARVRPSRQLHQVQRGEARQHRVAEPVSAGEERGAALEPDAP